MSKTVLGVVFAVWATGSSAAAQSLIGDRGASCANIPVGGGSHVITVTGAIPADSTVVIMAGTTGNATFLSTTDSAGNAWVATNSFAPSFRAFTIYGRIANALSAGQTITLSYSAAPPTGQVSCASVAAVRAVATTPFPPVDATSIGGSISNAPFVATTTSQPRELIHGGFVIAGAPGGVTVPPPANPLQLVCAPGNVICLVPAYQVATLVGGYSLSAMLGNSVPWGGVIVAYFSDVIFADGFQ
jgi:hypothetical protein